MKTKDRITGIMTSASLPAWEAIEHAYQSTAEAGHENPKDGLACYRVRELEAVRPMANPEQRAAIEIELIRRELEDELQPIRQREIEITKTQMRINGIGREIKELEAARKPLLERITTDIEAEIERLDNEVRWAVNAIDNVRGGGDSRAPALAEALGKLKERDRYAGPLTEKECNAYLEGLHRKSSELKEKRDAVEPLTSEEASTLSKTALQLRKLTERRDALASSLEAMKGDTADAEDAIGSALVRAWATMQSLGVAPIAADSAA